MATPEPGEAAGDEQVEHTPEAFQESEQLDEDTLDADPLEEGRDPPEGWTVGDEYGVTPSEERAGESLDRRLAQEREDTEA